MSTTDATWEERQALKRAERRLAFLQRLQEVTHGVHASDNLDDIMVDMSRDICALFGCDRLTLYAATLGRTGIKSRIKTGMDSFKDFELPITETSIAGYVALHKRSFNIKDVYDADELQSLTPNLRFLDKVDQRTGFRSREMVVAPIVNPRNGELLGVLQLINNRLGGPFSELIKEGALELCKTLAVAFERHMKDNVTVVTRFDPLVALGHLAPPELELAKRSARRKQQNLEDVLVDDFQVTLEQLGASYAKFFDVPYESFRIDRDKPAGRYTLKRQFVEHNGWLVLAEDAGTLTVVALYPDRLRATRAVENLFPDHDVELRVTTRREFLRMVEHIYGKVGTSRTAQSPEALMERMQRIVSEALAMEAPEWHALVRAAPAQSEDDDRTAGRGMRVNLEIKLKAS
ncbi:GAF domain-containing protein [Oxalobacteraceae bacterium OM1]|nr:GAF domain-containing protein [Oxalobacteraceae bacterium OM1]